jgi:hypothetical protein
MKNLSHYSCVQAFIVIELFIKFVFHLYFFISDYDECNPPKDVHIPDCGNNSVCTNLETTYECTCLEGFTRTGGNCTGTFL